MADTKAKIIYTELLKEDLVCEILNDISKTTDLSFKINKYKKDDKERKKIAKNGRDFYLRYINSTLVADFILSKTLDIKSKNSFVWER